MSRAIRTTAVLVAAFASACRGQPSPNPPIVLLRDMWYQQKYNPQSESPFFLDHRTMRTPEPGTVVHGEFLDDRELTGRELDNSAYVLTVPDTVSARAAGNMALVRRGQGRYGIYCSPCHGLSGEGDGQVFVRAHVTGYQYPPPANLTDLRIRHMPDGQLFATISNGVRNMPGYAAQVPNEDRWAIVAYVRALEISMTPATGGTP